METEEFDGTEIATLIFSCVQSINQRFGINYICAVLVGSKAGKIIKFGHHQIASYGALKQYSPEQIKAYIKELIRMGFLYQTKNEYPVIRLLDKANYIQLGTDKIVLGKSDPKLVHKTNTLRLENIEKTIELYKEGKSPLEIASLLAI